MIYIYLFIQKLRTYLPSNNLVLYENSHGWIIWRNWSKLHRGGWARMNINLLIRHEVGKNSRIPTNGRWAVTKIEERYICLKTTCNSEFQECNVPSYICVERDEAERMVSGKTGQTSRSQIVKGIAYEDLNFILCTMGIHEEFWTMIIFPY